MSKKACSAVHTVFVRHTPYVFPGSMVFLIQVKHFTLRSVPDRCNSSSGQPKTSPTKPVSAAASGDPGRIEEWLDFVFFKSKRESCVHFHLAIIPSHCQEKLSLQKSGLHTNDEVLCT